jgi:hypothetical protein
MEVSAFCTATWQITPSAMAGKPLVEPVGSRQTRYCRFARLVTDWSVTMTLTVDQFLIDSLTDRSDQ